MKRHLLPLALLVGFAGGCYSDADVGYSYGYPSSDLVYVSPGAYVIADYDYPVFFSEGVYWRYYGGHWFRSPYRDRGWAFTGSVPTPVRRIQSPGSYAHFHARGMARSHVVVRDHRRRR